MLRGMRIAAETGERFSSFGPYVPAIDDFGRIAFQACFVGGGSGVFVDGEAAYLSERGLGEVVSHPDLNVRNDLCFYAERDGETRAVRVRGDEAWESPPGVGPLGPTMNESGDVAYRGMADAVAGVFSSRDGLIAGPTFTEFHGLPLMTATGEVIFRADDGIFQNGRRIAGPLDEMGRFPCADKNGRLGYVGRRGDDWFVFMGDESVPAPTGWTLRGALINSGGLVVFFATPPGGELGIYRSGIDPALLDMGGPFEGSTVVDFALNPVSVNEAGQIAVRVKVADGREFIVQA